MTGTSRRAALCALALSLTAGAPVLADAPAVDAAGARALQGGLKAWLGAYLGGLGPDVAIAFDGPLTVVPQAGHYAVTVPGWRAGFPDDTAITAGPTTIAVTPEEGGLFATAWTLPSHLRFEADTVVTTEVTIGRPEGRGMFDGTLRLFRDLHISLGDVAAVPTPPDSTVLDAHLRLDEIYFDLTATPAPTTLWDVEAAAGVRGIDYREKTAVGDTSLQLGDAGFRLSSDGLDMPALLTFLSSASRLDGEDGVLSPAPSPQALAALAALMAETPKLFDDLSFGWSVSGFTSSDAGADPAVPPDRAALDAASFSVAIRGYREDTADTTILGHLAGLSVTEAEGFGGFMPGLFDLDLTLEDVPGSVMGQSLRDLVQGGMLAAPEAAFSFAGAQIMAAFESGASTIRLDRLLVDFGPWAVDLAGRLEPAAASPIGVAGDLSLVIGGMQVMLDQLGGLFASSPDDPALQALVDLGHPVTDTAGRPGRQYDLVIDAVSGSLTLNGTDIDDLE